MRFRKTSDRKRRPARARSRPRWIASSTRVSEGRTRAPSEARWRTPRRPGCARRRERSRPTQPILGACRHRSRGPAPRPARGSGPRRRGAPPREPSTRRAGPSPPSGTDSVARTSGSGGGPRRPGAARRLRGSRGCIPAGSPVGRDEPGRHAPELLRVRTEERLVQRSTEAGRDPILEGAFGARGDGARRAGSSIPCQRPEVLGDSEVPDEVSRLERIPEGATLGEGRRSVAPGLGDCRRGASRATRTARRRSRRTGARRGRSGSRCARAWRRGLPRAARARGRSGRARASRASTPPRGRRGRRRG